MNIRTIRWPVILFALLFASAFTVPPETALAQTNEEGTFFDRIKQNFAGLSMEEKIREFGNLTDKEKMDLFGKLNDKDKTFIFRNLSNADKEKILSAMSQAEKEEWLRKYPEVEKEEVTEVELPMAPRRPEAGLSGIERIMSGQFPTDISRELRQFGYDFFRKDVSTFTPVDNVPVGPDYVIGPGDSFSIYLWGKAEETYNVSVNRDGCIHVPRLGTLNVSGLTFSELKSHLERKFKQYYPDFDMSITMGRLRTIQIFIVGEANSPGTYSVSSLSTIITALFAAGGPSKNGSLRDIRLYRNGDTVKRLDLYDFFIKGFKGDDVRLQSGDTLFIPVLGPVVGIAGLVKRPAIYEMKGPQTIGEMVEIAGGVLPIGYLQNVVVERVSGHDRRVIRSFNLDPSYDRTDENLKMPLSDGDVIKIYPIHKRVRQVVYLEGHVKYPREYELRPGMRLRDIVRSYDDLLPEPYRPQAEIIRFVPPDLHPEIIGFNLGALLAGDESQNLPLQDLDRIIVYDTWEKQEKPEVTIKGSVRNPGTYSLYKGMTIKDLIFQAGNLTDRAYQDRGTLTRVMVAKDGTDTVTLSFSPRNAMAGIAQDNLPLQKDDVVHIRGIPLYSQALERKAYLEGEFLFPGEYSFSEGERLSSLIERAGGLTSEAYPFGAVFQRESVRKVQDQQLKMYIDKLEEDVLTLSAQTAETALDKEEAAILRDTLASKKQLLEKLKGSRSTGRMVINLPEVLLLPTSDYNFELKPGDRLIVARRPDSVNILGEVYNPTALLYEKGRTIGDYLGMVGGATDNADEGQIYVVKADGSVMSKSQEGFFGFATWDNKNYRWSMSDFDSIVLDAGDTVIVPKKIMKYPWLRLVKDITQITYQIAVSAGVVIAAF